MWYNADISLDDKTFAQVGTRVLDKVKNYVGLSILSLCVKGK